MTDVNSFFRTKLAEKKEDPIIDPGEAAAAGLAILSSPISKYVVPTVLGELLSKAYKPVQTWKGDSVYGLKRIGESKSSTKELLDYARKIKKVQGVDIPIETLKIEEGMFDKTLKPQKILGGLFEAHPRPKVLGELTTDPDNTLQLAKMQKSVNSMLDRYSLPEKGVTLSLRAGPISKKLGPHYNVPNKEIVLPKLDKSIALHEIGHAAHLAKPGSMAAEVARRALSRGSMLGVPMAFIAGDEIKKMFPGEVDDKVVDFVQKHAPAIVASTYAAASIYPEVQATSRAISHVYKTEGASAAKKTAKRLFPYLMSYTIPLVPSMVGIGLARKWHREAKENQEKLEKTANPIKRMVDFADELRIHTGNLLMQAGPQVGEILEQPMGEFMKTMYRTAKNVTGSPEFAAGAAVTGIPTAMISYLKLNTPHGHIYTDKKRELGLGAKSLPHGKGSLAAEIEYHKDKSKQDSITPAIIGMTSAISGGFLAKLLTDISRVM